jgi:hypothetical protein
VANILDSSAIKAVMESPVPIAALAIICFLAWRQMNLVNKTVSTTLFTFRKLFRDQNVTAKENAAAFKLTSKEFGLKVDALGDKLVATNAAIAELTRELKSVPVTVEKIVEQKLSMRPDTGSALEARLKVIENKQVIQNENTHIILEGLKKKFGSKQ